MPTRIDQTVPARVLRRSEIVGDYVPLTELTAHRFAGVLKHPVPWSEMIHKFDVNRPGWRVVVDWPRQAEGDDPVKAGDRLEVDGQTYPVSGVQQRAGCYLDIFIDEG